MANRPIAHLAISMKSQEKTSMSLTNANARTNILIQAFYNVKVRNRVF
jgi:hypothetical protein